MKISIYYFLYILITITISNSCKSEQSGISIERLDTELPVKVLLYEVEKNDSIIICLMVPQEFKMTNNLLNEIRLTQSYFRVSENRRNFGKYALFRMTDSLETAPGKLNYLNGQEEYFKLYAGYFRKISIKERDSLNANSRFSQKKYRMNVYDIGSVKDVVPYLRKKISDTLKGYIRFDFHNFKTDMGLVKDVPVKF